MPLVGFTCSDSPWTRATIADCEKCKNRCIDSIEVLRALWHENFEIDHPYHSDPKVVSLTTAIGCLRKAYYERTQDYTEEPQKLMARTTGTVIHRWLEHCSPEGAEVVFEHPLSGGYKFMATADVSLPGIVRDFKTCDRPTKTLGGGVMEMDDGQKIHINAMQLSALADLKEANGEDPVEELSIIQVSRRAIAKHDAYRVSGALQDALERAEVLLSALNGASPFALKLDGTRIKFYRMTMCSFCPFQEVCEQEVEAQ